MAFSLKNLIFSGIGTSLIGSGMLGSGYYSSRVTIMEEINNDYLDTEKFDNEWGKLYESLTNKKGIVDKDDLKKWCKSKYSETYSSIFGSKSKEYIDEIKNNCVYKLSSKLKENSEIFSGESDEEITKRLNEIKEKLTREESLNEKELEEIKKDGDLNNYKSILFNACESKYNQGYQGDEDKRFLFTKKYCTKNKVE